MLAKQTNIRRLPTAPLPAGTDVHRLRSAGGGACTTFMPRAASNQSQTLNQSESRYVQRGNQSETSRSSQCSRRHLSLKSVPDSSLSAQNPVVHAPHSPPGLGRAHKNDTHSVFSAPKSYPFPASACSTTLPGPRSSNSSPTTTVPPAAASPYLAACSHVAERQPITRQQTIVSGSRPRHARRNGTRHDRGATEFSVSRTVSTHRIGPFAAG